MSNYLKILYKELNKVEDESPQKYFEKFLKSEGSWYVCCSVLKAVHEADKLFAEKGVEE